MEAERGRCPFCDIPLLSYIDHDYDQGIFVECDACPACSFVEVADFIRIPKEQALEMYRHPKPSYRE